MKKTWKLRLCGLLATGGLLTALAWAETLEMVTYYPAPSAAGGDFDRLHANRATIGQDYNRANVPDADVPDGHLFVFDRIGVGTTTPAGPLHVVGVDDAVSDVILMPGADTAAAGTPDIRVGIGTAAPVSVLHVVTSGATNAGNNIFLDAYTSTANFGPELIERRARGTSGAPAAVQNGDDLGGITFNGYDGTGFAAQPAAVINAYVEGNPIAGSIPGAMSFSTNGGTDLRTRMTISSAGNVGIGLNPPTANPSPANNQATENLDVNDIWLRTANGGAGAWLSAGGAGGAGGDRPRVASSYTGNGAADRFINLGFQPTHVRIWSTWVGLWYVCEKWASWPMPPAYAEYSFYHSGTSGGGGLFGGGTNNPVDETRLEIRAGENGFRVGGTSPPSALKYTNNDGITYYYYAWE